VKILKRLGLTLAFFLVLISLFLMALIYFDWVSVGFVVGPYRFHHWSVIIGAFYVAIISPFFSVLKRVKPESLRNLFRVHVFGNLLAFLLVSVHFAGQLSRPLEFYPDLGTGIGLYSAMSVLVFTGFFLKYGLSASGSYRSVRAIHVLAVFSFYIVIVVHVLHGFGFI
jgi:hypothetical protein